MKNRITLVVMMAVLGLASNTAFAADRADCSLYTGHTTSWAGSHIKNLYF